MRARQQHVDYDAVVVGAGFSGLYMLHLLREAGYSVKVYEAGDDVGGVWYWNRYPGARCDSESIYYNYTFSKELYEEWSWSSRFPTQPEILDYLNFVADKFDLRRDIEFGTRVTSAHFHEASNSWEVTTGDGETVRSQFFITGVGCLSTANLPQFEGIDRFKGDWYHTGNWPHEGVDFRGKRVGIIGTGSSGIQSIPMIAKEAEHLTVFQRTPQYSIPAENHPYDQAYIEQVKGDFENLRDSMRHSNSGLAIPPGERSALEDPPEKREKIFEEAWNKGSLYLLNAYNDFMVNADANESVSSFIREKIGEIVEDPEIAEKLKPTYYFGTKRPVLDTDYYETYNRDNVSLVDVKAHPIEEITERGVQTSAEEHELDIIVFATGYDAMTGTLLKMDIRGRDGTSLHDKWAGGSSVQTYLGLALNGFPNMFTITGPESPSVLSNMPVSIEQHVEWIHDFIQYMDEHNMTRAEAEAEAEREWSQHCREVAEQTLFVQTDSWYTGANIDGKPRGFPIYLGGVGPYRNICEDVASNGYKGFTLNSLSEQKI
ncbi:flavin-containing monooxygenase [Virgibacillus xinjiangensis]|uniref:Flavin-containing monooxygenase n=1 Tax=Virgibacillus xinjiangensis TaxID=393090 RepID=A0ABV7CTK5_9BACI